MAAVFGNKNAYKHGGCPNRKPSPEYQSWYHMKDRCLNPESDHWSMYGGRGIKVCKRWLNYQNFVKDMGKRPSLSVTLDRIDNDGDYKPSNCRWATWDIQFSNRRYKYETK